jgi:HAD superfamily hydrolase (TIGR01490 family)
VTLAIFDLDGTLLEGDSDYSWGQFLVEQNLVDVDLYKKANDRFYQDYVAGTLNIHEYLEFSLAPLKNFSESELDALHKTFVEQKINPMIHQKALDLIADHRKRGHFLLIITATNQFVTGPISKMLGMDDLIAPIPEIIDGRHTGKIVGIPSFQAGKVTRLHSWLKETGHSLEGSYFYSDSHNDLPLLEQVAFPVAVDADKTLADIAMQKGWPHISLRD